MAVLQVDFRSKTLKRQVAFQPILTTERFKAPYPTLYLLHGLTDNSNGWLHNTRIRMWAEEMGLAVVMPSGENSFYHRGAFHGWLWGLPQWTEILRYLRESRCALRCGAFL